MCFEGLMFTLSGVDVFEGDRMFQYMFDGFEGLMFTLSGVDIFEGDVMFQYMFDGLTTKCCCVIESFHL